MDGVRHTTVRVTNLTSELDGVTQVNIIQHNGIRMEKKITKALVGILFTFH